MDGIKQSNRIEYLSSRWHSFNLVLWASTCTCTRQLEDNDLNINVVKFMTPGSMALVVILWTRVYCNHLETRSTFLWNVVHCILGFWFTLLQIFLPLWCITNRVEIIHFLISAFMQTDFWLAAFIGLSRLQALKSFTPVEV